MAGLFDFAKGDKPSPFDFAPRKKKDRSFLYNLYDNIAGVDDGVNTPGERLGKGVNDLAKGLAADPAGMAGRAVQGVKGDMDNLMFEGGAMQRPQDVLGYAAAPMAPGAMSGRVANVLSSGGHKPSQDVLDLLKSGRGSEVTDEMMAAADPQFLYNNYDLPMDEASRMQRAGEMGFDTGTPLYHGTGADIQAFDPRMFGKRDEGFAGRGVYSTDEPMLAEEYGDSIIPHVRASSKDFVVNPERGISSEGYDTVLDRFGVSRERDLSGANSAKLTSNASSEGYEGVWINDRLGDEVAAEVVTFDPRNIRSKFARFDPRLKHLSNLSAAGAGAAYLGAQGGEKEQMAQIRAYLEGKQ